jgi:hypothetical protein
VDPPLLDPIVDLLGDDTESPGQVGDPPFVLTDEVIAEEFPDEAKITDYLRTANASHSSEG